MCRQQRLGRGCAEALGAEGANLVITARGEADAGLPLPRCAWPTRHRGARRGGRHHHARGRTAALAACPQVDVLVNAGGPPPGDFRDWSRDAWIAALDANMLTPIDLIKATVDAMAERGFGRVVNITSAAVKAPNDVLGLSTAPAPGLPASWPAWRGNPGWPAAM